MQAHQAAQYLVNYWKAVFVFAKNEMAICVPEDVSGLEAAMAFCEKCTQERIQSKLCWDVH